MVNVRRSWRDLAPAIETACFLHLVEDWQVYCQGCAFCSKEKLIEINGRAEHLSVAFCKVGQCTYDSRGVAGVLPQNYPFIRARMRPVIGDKLFGNLVGLDYKGRAVVLSVLNADIRNRKQQGILIGGGELPFAEQALDVAQKLKLLLEGIRKFVCGS